jgi:hypothetical protein
VHEGEFSPVNAKKFGLRFNGDVGLDGDVRAVLGLMPLRLVFGLVFGFHKFQIYIMALLKSIWRAHAYNNNMEGTPPLRGAPYPTF